MWICPVEDNDGDPHFAKGEFKSFVIRAGPLVAGRGAAPEADVVIGLLDFSFALDTALTPGRHTIRVDNRGVEPRLVLMKLALGRTIDDVQTWLNPERARRADQSSGPAPSLESLGTLAGGIAAIAPGMETYFEADFTPGEYALVCMATAPDGRSHVEYGMVRQIAVH